MRFLRATPSLKFRPWPDVGEVDEAVLDLRAAIDEVIPPLEILGVELDDQDVVHRRDLPTRMANSV